MVLSARNSHGYINIILILIILVFSVLLGGNFFTPSEPKIPPVSTGSCCETGNGDVCRLIDPSIQFEGRTYKLLKSDIGLTEGTTHLVDTGIKTDDDKKIFKNNIGETINGNGQRVHPDCGDPGDDLIFTCEPIPNDSLIYVCKSGCDGVENQGLDQFDAYFQSDPPVSIPDSIKNCTTPNNPLTVNSGRDVIVFPTPAPSSEPNLQLRYFKIIQGTAPWLSPWCKPAIYLYPEKETEINVKVDAVGGLISTIPKYPAFGWDVTAYPDGQINYQGMNLDYLYYESRIPDGVVEKPREGWVMEYKELQSFLEDLLPELGLNSKENRQFRQYWTKVLPKSPYYFVGLISDANIEKMSQLNITPKPDSILRVVFYFETLDTPIAVEPPKLEKMPRSGFTVVEWGGVFKSDKNHSFSCLM